MCCFLCQCKTQDHCLSITFLLKAKVVKLLSKTHHGSQWLWASKSSLVWGLSRSPSFCNVHACVLSLLMIALSLQCGSSSWCRNSTAYRRALRWFEVVTELHFRTSCKERKVSIEKKPTRSKGMMAKLATNKFN